MARGNIEKRGANAWRIRIYLGVDENGKQLYHRETFNGTRKQAEKRRTELLREIDTGGYVEPLKDTLGAFLDRWLTETELDYKPSTRLFYKHAVRRLKGKLGHIPLQQLKPLDLKAYYRWALTEGRADKKGGLAKDTVRGDYRTIHKALEDAVTWGLVARNVADGSGPPTTKPKTRNVWTPDEAARFLEAAKRTRVYALYALALTTGLRRGELFGLRRDDVDLTTRELRVTQTIVVLDGHLHIQSIEEDDDPAKTDTSENPIIISEKVAALLKKHLAKQAKQRLLMGDRYEDHGLIFAQANGRPLRPDQFTKRDFPKLCQKAGVRRIRFHDMRHSYATKLLLEGKSLRVVQERMRHADPATTMRFYSHLTREAVHEAAAATDDILPDDPEFHASELGK